MTRYFRCILEPIFLPWKDNILVKPSSMCRRLLLSIQGVVRLPSSVPLYYLNRPTVSFTVRSGSWKSDSGVGQVYSSLPLLNGRMTLCTGGEKGSPSLLHPPRDDRWSVLYVSWFYFWVSVALTNFLLFLQYKKVPTYELLDLFGCLSRVTKVLLYHTPLYRILDLYIRDLKIGLNSNHKRKVVF